MSHSISREDEKMKVKKTSVNERTSIDAEAMKQEIVVAKTPAPEENKTPNESEEIKALAKPVEKDTNTSKSVNESEPDTPKEIVKEQIQENKKQKTDAIPKPDLKVENKANTEKHKTKSINEEPKKIESEEAVQEKKIEQHAAISKPETKVSEKAKKGEAAIEETKPKEVVKPQEEKQDPVPKPELLKPVTEENTQAQVSELISFCGRLPFKLNMRFSI